MVMVTPRMQLILALTTTVPPAEDKEAPRVSLVNQLARYTLVVAVLAATVPHRVMAELAVAEMARGMGTRKPAARPTPAAVAAACTTA